MFLYEFDGRPSSSSPVSVVTLVHLWRRASSIRAARIALCAPLLRNSARVAAKASHPTPSWTYSAPAPAGEPFAYATKHDQPGRPTTFAARGLAQSGMP